MSQSRATLAPWLQTQLGTLLTRQAHALLLEGPDGLGQMDLALALAQSWLCEAPEHGQACGRCESCHLVQAHTHPDLQVLMPEVQMLEMGWPLDEKAQSEIDDKKRKPSKDIRVEALRATIEFSQLSTARGCGKVVVLYPAERMNHVSANALLKTLEEPPGMVRFVLASEASHMLLPTIRSRCQSHAMHWPERVQAQAWLEQHHPDAARLLDAAGQRPGLALSLAARGLTADLWRQLPKAAARGQADAFGGLSIAEQIDVLQKICHDLWLSSAGADPRFFEVADLPKTPGLRGLQDWTLSLKQHARVAEHPFHAGLMTQSLLAQAQAAINSKA